jgi:hypothetical protein
MGIKDWISNWRQPEPVRDPWAGMNEALGNLTHTVVTFALKQGQQEERVRIAEWLRGRDDAESLQHLADAIEAGEHAASPLPGEGSNG